MKAQPRVSQSTKKQDSKTCGDPTFGPWPARAIGDGESKSKLEVYVKVKRIISLAICILALVPSGARAVRSTGEIPIPRNSKVYIDPGDLNFYLYLAAAITAKHTPVTIVTDRSQAEFIITVDAASGKDPSTAEKWLLGKYNENEDAAAVVKRASDGAVCYAYSVHKFNSVHGRQSTAEAIAKHLKGYMEQ